MLKFKNLLWLCFLALPLSLYYASFFAPFAKDSTFGTLGLFYIASLGHFFLYFFLLCLVFIFAFLFIKNEKIKFGVQIFILSLAFITLAIDAHVFSLYRFHLNFAMLDLFFNADGQVIELSSSLKFWATFEILCIIVYVFCIVILARNLSYKFLNKFIGGGALPYFALHYRFKFNSRLRPC